MKKILSLVLALAMLLSMVLTATAEEAEVYRFDKPITLKVSVFDRGNAGGTAPDDNYYTKWIQENFGDPRNITIEWVVIPRSEEEAKLNQLLGENVIDAGRKNGGLYAICARRVNIADQGVFIRKDWVEKAGLEMPPPRLNCWMCCATSVTTTWTPTTIPPTRSRGRSLPTCALAAPPSSPCPSSRTSATAPWPALPVP